MALPTTIVSKAGIAGHGRVFRSSDGNFYSVGIASADTGIGVYRATDPSSSWTEHDASNNPTSPVSECLSVVQKGDELHMAWWTSDTTGSYKYGLFDMSAGTNGAWQNVSGAAKEQSIEAIADNPTFPWISIAVRSDGDVVVVYAGDTDAVMGGAKERVDVKVRTSGTWGSTVALDAAGDIHYGNPNCVKASDSDDIHIVWQTTTNTADPPTLWEGCETRTIGSSDALSTVDTGGADSQSTLLGMSNGVSFNNAGTQNMRFVYVTDFTGACFMLDDAGTAGKTAQFETTEATELAGITFSPKINGEAGIITIANLGPDLHVLWSNGDDTDDIYYSTSTDTGDTWSAEAQELDAVACNYISASIYQRGSQLVLAYVYDDGGVTKYNEKNLTTPSMSTLSAGKLTGLVNTHVGPFEI